MTTAASEKRWARQYPELGTSLIPTESYISKEYFERERERIFKQSWLMLGRVEEIPKPGDYFVREVEIAKTSIIVVRGQDGLIRGFHNVCRHRGNRVATTGCGSAKGFMCGFHGWTYDREGRLIYVPDEDQFFDLQKSELGLIPVATDVWEGFVFVHMQPQPQETLQESMGELLNQLQGYPFETMSPVARYAADVKANWKVCVDVTQESYHFQFVHKQSIPDSNTSADNPFSHFPSIRLYKRHRTASVYANPEHTPTTAEAVAFKYGPAVLQGTAGHVALPEALNPERSPNWAFDAISIFPNLILLLGNGWYVAHRYWPLAVDRTIWRIDMYMSKPANAGQKIGQEFSKVLNRDLLREDMSTLEGVQASLASGVLTHMVLNDEEIMLRHNHKVMMEYIDSRSRREQLAQTPIGVALLS